MAPISVEELARQIASDLFRNGFGNKASRLLMKLPDGRLDSGWSENAVAQRIASFIAAWLEELARARPGKTEEAQAKED